MRFRSLDLWMSTPVRYHYAIHPLTPEQLYSPPHIGFNEKETDIGKEIETETEIMNKKNVKDLFFNISFDSSISHQVNILKS